MTAPTNGDRPLVTVVVPVMNGVPYLRESLDSILGQTYPNLEVIVLDDASTDETPQVLADYEGRGVRVVRQPERRGIYANANDGILQARGELIGVFHGDDVYLPTMVEREVELLERRPEVGAAFACDVFVTADGRELGRLALPPELTGSRPLDYGDVLNALLTHKNVFLRCPSALVRASVYRTLGLYDQDRFANTADLEMWLRIARVHRLAVVDEHLFRYRRGHGSSSERYHGLRVDEERFFRILDRELALGGRAHAEPAALAAYEAHRAEDVLMRCASHYVRGSRRNGLALLRTVRVRQMLGSTRVQRLRLVLLYAALHVLLRGPRSNVVAAAFRRRWHGAAAVAPPATAGAT